MPFVEQLPTRCTRCGGAAVWCEYDGKNGGERVPEYSCCYCGERYYIGAIDLSLIIEDDAERAAIGQRRRQPTHGKVRL